MNYIIFALKVPNFIIEGEYSIMKPIYLQKHTATAESSFFVRYAEVPYTYNKFHYHKEYEILFNIENNGTRFVGDSIHRFTNGDLVLIGPYLPHYWHSDDQYYEGREDLKAKVIVIQFLEKFAGKKFVGIPEMRKTNDLFSRARQGIQFKGRDATRIGEKIIQIYEAENWKRLLLMIEMLCMMSESEDYKLLSSEGFAEASRNANQERISDLFDFIISNYSRDLKLEEVADKANMNTSAFCRYFKKATSRTFSQVLNEIRIGFACKKMINTDLSISEIAYDCGYMNIPYFNKVFKYIKGVTPQVYRNKHFGHVV